MNGEGGINDIKTRLSDVEVLCNQIENQYQPILRAADYTGLSGIVIVGNEIRLSIGTLPEAG